MRLFLLSPANCRGRRAQMLLDSTSLPLAARLREPPGAPVADVFAFVSGLYFRGKVAYARAFAREGDQAAVITPSRGLVPMDCPITPEVIDEFARTPIDLEHPGYREPLERDLLRLAREPDLEVVLLGSIASDKYVALLLEHLGSRVLFPATFVGRGDMSRGGLMLRAASAGVELDYIPLAGAVRRGTRPPRLTPLKPGPSARAAAAAGWASGPARAQAAAAVRDLVLAPEAAAGMSRSASVVQMHITRQAAVPRRAGRARR